MNILDGSGQKGETVFEEKLRPQKLSEYLGQEDVLTQLRLYVKAALMRKESLDHTLIYGPPGLGKTTMAHVLAHELGSGIKVTSGPAIVRPGDLAAILTNLEEGQVLFIDEIHRLSVVVEELLYPAMEDYSLDIILGEGPSARSLRLDLPPFTLVGATTRAGLLTAPMRDRFGIIQRLQFYKVEELVSIIKRSARILNVGIVEAGAQALAHSSRGTPRIANRLLKRVRDYAQIEGDGVINESIAWQAMALMQVDKLGLDELDRAYLTSIALSFDGGPVGVETLATALREDVGTLEDMIEPYLMQCGLIQRGPRGRQVTSAAYSYLNIPTPATFNKNAAHNNNEAD